MLFRKLGIAVVVLSVWLLAAANGASVRDESTIAKGLRNNLVNSGALQALDGKACKPGRKNVDGLCVPCSAGTYSPRGIGECMKCPAGKSSKVGQGHCTPCLEGTYNDLAGSPSCKKCAPGTENRMNGSVVQDACVKCAPGTASKDGVKCVPCESGSFAATPGSHSCDLCGYGAKSVWNKTLSPNRGPTKCTDCPSGRYRTEKGGDFCEPCWPGSANK